MFAKKQSQPQQPQEEVAVRCQTRLQTLLRYQSTNGELTQYDVDGSIYSNRKKNFHYVSLGKKKSIQTGERMDEVMSAGFERTFI